VYLHSGCETIRRRHPWVYRDADVQKLRCRTGDVVDVHDARDGAFLASGIYDEETTLAIRLFTWTAGEAIDDALVDRRLDAAAALRERFVDRGRTSAYRVVNGEGDGLPGLVVDRYDDYAVVAPYAALWIPRLPRVAARLAAALGLRGVALKMKLRRAAPSPAPAAPGPAEAAREPAGEDVTPLWGEPIPEELVVREHGLRFLAHTRAGQKTGLFLDQKDNRRAVAALCRGARVLNTFSYTGGFSVYAAAAGAAATVSVDLARACAVYARRNFELNDLPTTAHDFVAADVFDYLADAAHGTFDVVILDPPSFATSRKQVFSARKGYVRLIQLACDRTAPGGLLVCCSCTAQIDAPTFADIAAEAAARARRDYRVLEVRGLPADHPTAPGHPEGRYLKCLVGVLP
jgi:23S rRNA (cytosine1962-C5)-methyltransferase